MRSKSVPSFLLLLCCLSSTSAFTVHTTAVTTSVTKTRLVSSLYSSSPQQQEERLGADLYDDALLTDMELCLELLNQRARDGAGSLTRDQVESFQSSSSRVLEEMKGVTDQLPERLPPGQRKAAAEAAAAKAAAAAERSGASKKEIEQEARRVYEKVLEGKERVDITSMDDDTDDDTVQAATAPVAAAIVTTPAPVQDLSEDEGPAYDGTGGMGLARGTANTYHIEGMEEMSPEEYQEALAQQVIDFQKQRRYSGTRRGARTTDDYLVFLNGGKKPEKMQ